MFKQGINIIKIGDVLNVTFDGFTVPCFVNKCRYGIAGRIEINVSCAISTDKQSRWVPIGRALYPMLNDKGCLIGFNLERHSINVMK